MFTIGKSDIESVRLFFSLFIVLFIFFWSFPTAACGCGLLIMDSDTVQGWEYGQDTTEKSLIAYEGGIEHLLIGLDVQPRETGAALITPIPSAPEGITSDILSGAPDFSGYDIGDRAQENLETIMYSLIGSQLYTVFPLIIPLLTSSFGLSGSQLTAPTSAVSSRADGTGVSVYQHIAKEGMIAEVLSAKTSDALYTYLRAKGLSVAQDSIPVFRDYIRDDFSFVVAWIDPSQDNLSAKALTIAFPTDTLFYPLKPNSAYTGAGKPKEILIAGYVTPKLYDTIEPQSDVSYHYDDSPIPFEHFIPNDHGFGFTRLRISANPSYMNEDITFSRVAPPTVYLAHSASVYPIAFGILVLLVIAYIATLISLWIAKPQFKRPVSTFELTAINSLTLIGAIIATRRYILTHRFKYVAYYSIVFLTATVVIMFLLDLLLGTLR